MKLLREVLKGITDAPGKSLLTVFTVGAGVAVLILALSLSAYFSDLVEEQLSAGGLVLTFANAERNAEGELQPVRPPQFDERLLSLVPAEVSGVLAISPVVNVPQWREMRIEAATYQIRSVLGVSEQYAELMGLQLLAGSLITAEDVAGSATKAVIGESLAGLLFGSAAEAIGRTFQPPSLGRPFAGGQRVRRNAPPPLQAFTVAGVFADPAELQRKAYGVADILIPYTAAFPMALSSPFARGFLMATEVVKVKGSSAATAEAQLREVLTRAYGEDLSLLVWEGTPRGETSWLDQARRTIATFDLVVNLLGFVLLISGAIGILSIMLVEVLGRSRDIALQRAFGASRQLIVVEFLARSAALSVISSAVGLALSLLFAGPLGQLLQPVLAGLGIGGRDGAVVRPAAVLIAFACAVLIGGAFGILPVFSALKTPISEGLREV